MDDEADVKIFGSDCSYELLFTSAERNVILIFNQSNIHVCPRLHLPGNKTGTLPPLLLLFNPTDKAGTSPASLIAVDCRAAAPDDACTADVIAGFV